MYFRRLKIGVKRLGPVNAFLFWGLIVTALLSFFYFVFTTKFGATKINQEKQLSQTQKALTILENMEKIDRTQYNTLITKYPLGYALFAVDHHELIIPYKWNMLKNFHIKWGTAKILNMTEKWISIRLPDIITKNNTIFFGNVNVIPRKIGQIGGAAGGSNGVIWTTELLVDNAEGLTFVIGFKEYKSVYD